MCAIFLKEFKSYFYSATGYIFMGVFLFISGWFFIGSNISAGSAYYNGVLQYIIYVFLVIIPILTMKILSEEAKTKTDQLLLTSPIKLKDIVLGKYFAAGSIFLITIVITLIYPLILSRFGNVSVSEIFCGYVGLFLLGMALISIGMFMSSLTENQVISAALTFAALLFIYLMQFVRQILPSTRKAGIIFALILLVIIAVAIYIATKNVYACAGTGTIGIICILIIYLVKKAAFDGFLGNFFGWFSLLERYSTFSEGMMSLSSIVYFISFSALFVFFTVNKLEKRRWN